MTNTTDSTKSTLKNSNNTESKKVPTQFSNISLMTQSPSTDSLLNDDNNNNCENMNK